MQQDILSLFKTTELNPIFDEIHVAYLSLLLVFFHIDDGLLLSSLFYFGPLVCLSIWIEDFFILLLFFIIPYIPQFFRNDTCLYVKRNTYFYCY